MLLNKREIMKKSKQKSNKKVLPVLPEPPKNILIRDFLGTKTEAKKD